MTLSDDVAITRLLRAADDGEPDAQDALMRCVYDDLTRMAELHLRRHHGPSMAGITLEPAALVNETYMRLIKQRNRFDNRGQFFAIATRLMLRVLVDHQRQRSAAKRGGDQKRLAIDLDLAPGRTGSSHGATTLVEIESLVTALGRLERLDARKADVVKLRVVWGLEMAEIAETLEISLATVERDWAFAKAWLAREAAGTDSA